MSHPLPVPLPPARARRALRRDVDDHPRRQHRDRGAARDPARPGLLPRRPDLDRQRLPDRLRRPAAAGRTARRPGRPQAGVRRRAWRCSPPRRWRAASPPAGDADRRAVPAGRRRRAGLGGQPRHDRHAVPRAARARHRDRRVQLRRRGRRLDRPGARRGPHRGAQLALDLLHQPADRPRRGRPRAYACWSPTAGSAYTRPAPTALGAALVTGGLMLGVYTIVEADRYGWGSAHTLGFALPSRSPCSPRSSSGRRRPPEPAAAAADVPVAERLRRQPHPGPDGVGAVRVPDPHRPVHAERPRLRRRRYRPGDAARPP